MPIDLFLRSLAEEQEENSVGIILSGTGTDGTLGLRAILGAGGVSFVQEPSTAKYDGMPANAVQSGLATYVLPVEKIPEQLIAYMNTLIEKKTRPDQPVPATTSSINKIMMTLKSKTGHDFSLYKQSTIKRRIERRMTIHKIEDTNIYARYLNEHPDEVQRLFKELLINVTSFFRDTEAFAALKKDILPRLFENKPEYNFRVWSPGCSTGEEAYSIAMLFREYMDDLKEGFRVQIFGTDIDEDAQAVLDSLIPWEKQVLTTNKAWYIARIRPYRTLENVIDGVVLTFVDITEIKKAEEEFKKAREYAENIVNTVREPLIILNADLKVVSANISFYKNFHLSRDEIKDQQIYDLGNSQWDIPRLRELLEAILTRGTSFDNYEVEHEFPEIGYRKMLLNARRIVEGTGTTQLILLAIEDVTDKGKTVNKDRKLID